MDRVKVFLLHGFLGQPQDWSFLLSHKSVPADFELIPVDYFHESPLGPDTPMEQWGEAFNHFVREKDGFRNYLVGYSLGGRLALQSLAEDPSLWTGATLLSTQPGFLVENQVDRHTRAENDKQWGRRFQTEEWPLLLRDWNAQKVFAGSVEPKRKESDYDRSLLQKSLESWSLARQPDLREIVRTQVGKINWVVGERDTKFLNIAKELKEGIPQLEMKIMANASHRIIFDQPDACAEMLVRQIKKAVNL